MAKKQSLCEVVEGFIFDKLELDEYQVSKIPSNDLVSWNRLDIGFKLAYLRLQSKNNYLARDVYWNDIRAQSMGGFVEPGNGDKHGFEVYVNTFHEIHASINNDSFDDAKTIVPLSREGCILNGSHRTSAAIDLEKEIFVVHTELDPLVCDHEYFFNRAVPVEYIELALLKMVEKGRNFHLAFLWPSGADNLHSTRNMFSNVAYRKKIDLGFNGALNLLYECYHHMDWVGSENNNYLGLRKKLSECFPRNNFEVEVILFQEPNGLDAVQEVKEEIRQVNGIGFSSVHITDTDEEVKRLASYLFNENGLHYLIHRLFGAWEPLVRVNQIKNDLLSAGIDLDDVVVDGSFVLECYGLRQSRDIDFMFGDAVDSGLQEGFDNHDEQLVYHGVGKENLIYNPKFYFLLSGVKVVSLSQIAKMKKTRGEKKDNLDLNLVDFLVKDSPVRKAVVVVHQKWLYAKLRWRRRGLQLARSVLSGIGLYSPARSLYRRLRR